MLLKLAALRQRAVLPSLWVLAHLPFQRLPAPFLLLACEPLLPPLLLPETLTPAALPGPAVMMLSEAPPPVPLSTGLLLS